MKFFFCFHTSSPTQEKFSASLDYPSQPATGGVFTQDAVFGLETYKCTSTDFVTMKDLPDTSTGLQVEWMQTSSLGNVNAPSMHTCSILSVP